MEQEVVYNLFDHKHPMMSPRNMPPPIAITMNMVPASLANKNLIPIFSCPSTPDVPANYFLYSPLQALGAPNPWELPRTDYAPMRGASAGMIQAVTGNAAPANCERDNIVCNNAMMGTPEGFSSAESNGAQLITKNTIKFGEVTDGLSNTICIVERAGLMREFFRGKPRPGAQVFQNASWIDWDIARHPRVLSGADITNPYNPGTSVINVYNVENPYSFHTGGVQTLRGDGSVAFLSQNIELAVFYGLMTKSGGEVVTDPSN
jgi:hypothetical protein